ncbi:hypothetical protein M885DRAFT_557014 [Pelagophyceae sp. CCMP2097]|nr:hypothetical protein M885DRAFT_557014 [Pelagophyceae sp. CCMP2097]
MARTWALRRLGLLACIALRPAAALSAAPSSGASGALPRLPTPDLDRDGCNVNAGVAIRESPGKGFGAFATRAFARETVVGDYVGERLSQRDVDGRYKGADTSWRDKLWLKRRSLRGVPLTGDYIFKVEDDLYIDAEDHTTANWARFVNHGGEESNMRVKSLAYSFPAGDPRVWFVSTVDIQQGDELLFDYGEEYWFEDDQPINP